MKYLVYREKLLREVRSLIYEDCSEFMTGMAEGADLDFAECVLDLRDREEYDITLEAALPYPIRPQSRVTEYGEKRNAILERCDRIYTVSSYYHKGCMQKRNCYMVDKADVVLAVWNGEMQGGTWNTIRYARSKGKEIRYIMLHEIGDSLYEECQFPKHDTLPHSTD